MSEIHPAPVAICEGCRQPRPESPCADDCWLHTDEAQRPQNKDEHLCFIWCDGKVDVKRLASKNEAHTWHRAHAAVWHLVDKSQNAGSLILPASEPWTDVQGKDGIPGYVAATVRSYLTKSMPDRRYLDRCRGVSTEVRSKADAITRGIREQRLDAERAQLRRRWSGMTPTARARAIAAVGWASAEARQLAEDACTSTDPDVILTLAPDMEAVDDVGWQLRRGNVAVRLFCAELPRLTGKPMTALADDRELRWPEETT